MDGSAPLMQTVGGAGWKVVSRAEATKALRLLVSTSGRDPRQYALHSGRIGGAATHLAAKRGDRSADTESGQVEVEGFHDVRESRRGGGSLRVTSTSGGGRNMNA